ncbi:MAG: Flp pilus assembly protein CpaB [Nocardioidaceae bacterium]
MDQLRRTYRRFRRAVLARRRLLAALCAAGAVAAGLQATSVPPPATASVLTAARDLPAGAVLGAGDLTWTAFAPGSVPAGVLHDEADAVGRTTAAPLRRGEPLTDVRLVTGSLLRGYPGMVAAPVRIGDPGSVALLRVGDHVDVVAADPQGRNAATVVAAHAAVVAIPRERRDALASSPGGTSGGGLVVLAVPETTAQDLAEHAVSTFLSVLIDR